MLPSFYGHTVEWLQSRPVTFFHLIQGLGIKKSYKYTYPCTEIPEAMWCFPSYFFLKFAVVKNV